ncbi:multicopper oxidase family protein [Streptomyces hainanensis]|uniref:Copper oxidase n=1 Tax=Streptomyces hainanensis TaxID=402648 RepID=A0A4R4SQS0_9ACTN|nr:multicopper oxidase domain-containing protein [Streptomyces hainanensis]TDC66290.1 copper oxidase [Streptomyces hainanensis]
MTTGGDADTWGYNGALLGPTLRVRSGEQIRVNVRNDLDEATTVHWHGMRLPAACDGGPHQKIEPGATWSPTWKVFQPGATLWYHPHPHGSTEVHVYRGLGGMLLVDDDETTSEHLPHRYGQDDIPLIVQDKTFDEFGKFVEADRRGVGMLGTTLLVNGAVGPTFQVTSELTRFRLLNASTARSYSFGFSDDRPFHIIASDGGLLDAPVSVDRVRLTPAERVEIVVRMAPGERVVLHSYPQDLGAPGIPTGADDQFDVLPLIAAGKLRPSPQLPHRLTRVRRLDPGTAVATRDFELRSDRINDEHMDMARIDQVVTVDTVEIWHVTNVSLVPHNFHVHGMQFQVVSVDEQPPPAELAGWKDTVFAPPGVQLRLVMRFAKYSDPDLPYMYHCHLLWHEDAGVMGQFVVVKPGEEAGTVTTGLDWPHPDTPPLPPSHDGLHG